MKTVTLHYNITPFNSVTTTNDASRILVRIPLLIGLLSWQMNSDEFHGVKLTSGPIQPAFHPLLHASWWRTGSKANILNCSLHFCLFLFPFPSSFPFWLGVYLGAFATTSYCRSSAGGREAPCVPCVCVCVCVCVCACNVRVVYVSVCVYGG